MFTRAICCFLFLLVCAAFGATTLNTGSGTAFESLNPRSDGYPWWDDDWLHRARVYIDNQFSQEVLHEFPIQVNVPYRPSMQPDFSDLRFTDMDGNPLPYWVEEAERSSRACIWVRVPVIPNAQNIFIYYGNPDASSESCDEGYAEVCESFNEDPTRSGGWSVYRHAGDDSQEASWDPAEKVLYLTRHGCNLGTALFADIDLNGLNGWYLSFDYRAGGGTGAEGLCVMIYKDETPYGGGTPSCGGGLGFTTADGEQIPGYGIEFDAHQEEGDPNGPHVALIEDGAGSHLMSVHDGRVCDGLWHHTELVRLHGGLSLKLDSDYIFYDYTFNIPGGDKTHGGLGFCASTGELTNDHVIDNVLLRKWTNPMPSTLVGYEESQDDMNIVETSFGHIKALYR
jgi:hypothetical protein